MTPEKANEIISKYMNPEIEIHYFEDSKDLPWIKLDEDYYKVLNSIHNYISLDALVPVWEKFCNENKLDFELECEFTSASEFNWHCTWWSKKEQNAHDYPYVESGNVASEVAAIATAKAILDLK